MPRAIPSGHRRPETTPGVLVRPRACALIDFLFDGVPLGIGVFAAGLIEELVHELKGDYTIVMVTHNLQQAAWVADYTAFTYLGKLVEVR